MIGSSPITVANTGVQRDTSGRSGQWRPTSTFQIVSPAT